MTLSRRHLLGSALAIPFALSRRQQCLAASVPSLGEIAASHGVLFGTAYDQDVLKPSAFSDLYVVQARIFTSNNFLKFGSLRPSEDAAEFGIADQLIAFARGRNIQVRGHNLIWNDWTPEWLRALPANRVAYWLDRHIDETAGRYRGLLHSWDVVNEPFWPQTGNEGGYRSGPWLSAMGKSYVARALKRARAADPTVKLVINESGPEWVRYWNGMDGGVVRKALLRLVDEVQHAGAPLDAIGLQCHWMAGFEFSPSVFEDFLGQLAERKIAIYLTEMDVSDAQLEGDMTERDAEVARRYHALISTALKTKAVEVVQTWELSDNATWQREPPFLGPGGRLTRPLPFDDALQPKAAYEAIAKALTTPRV